MQSTIRKGGREQIDFCFCIQAKTYISKLYLPFQRTYIFISLAFEKYLSMRKPSTYCNTLTNKLIDHIYSSTTVTLQFG